MTGSGVAAYMIIPGVGYETSSGGPFFRGRAASLARGVSSECSRPSLIDIDNQGSDQQELYFYMNSNHEQTETYRTGFFGPYVMLPISIDKLVSNGLHTIIISYAIAFTTGSAPSGNLDTSFMESLNLQGFVGASGRGTVSGSYSNTLSGQPVTVGFKVQSFMMGDDSASFLQEFCSTVLGFWFRVRCI